MPQNVQKTHWKNIKKDTWKQHRSPKIIQTGPRRGVQGQICLLDPQKCKNEAKMAPPRGPLGPPQGSQNRQNREKKVIKKSSFFQHPSGKGFDRFLTSKIDLKWVQNEVSESRGRGNSKKRKNLKFAIPSTKNTYFSRSENMRNWENPKKCMLKTKLSQRWPSRSDFSWFCLHFGTPRRPWNHPKQSKKS